MKRLPAMKRIRFASPLLLLAILGSCSSDSTEPKRRVALTAHVLKGSTPGVGAIPAGASATARAVAPASGLWAISPNQASITINSIAFIQADGTPSTDSLGTTCVVSYNRSTASLTKLLDCPFVIDPGTYVALDVGIKNSFDVLIDDQINNIYTDPSSSTKLSTTRPAGGGQMVNYSVTLSADQKGELHQRIYLNAPVTIDSGATLPSLSLVADMIHTVFVTASASSMTFWTDLPLPGVFVIPSLDGAGRVEYYTASGTALNALMPGATNNDASSVRVFYASPPQPAYIISPVVGPSSAQAANPAKSAVLSELGYRAGGYAGLDASGVLCWALPTSFNYQTYAYLRRMQSVSTIGASTTLQTLNLNGGTATPPTSGDTYASGCPSFTPTSQLTVVLVAK
jgi:hypothetical protein